MALVSVGAWWFLDSPVRPPATQSAERFLRLICLGEAADPAAQGALAPLSGYAQAFDMLDEPLRAALGFSAFCGEFADCSERLGPVVRIEALPPRRLPAASGVRYRFLLHYGPRFSRAAQPSGAVFRLDMILVWKGGAWVVKRFRFGPEAPREIK